MEIWDTESTSAAVLHSYEVTNRIPDSIFLHSTPPSRFCSSFNDTNSPTTANKMYGEHRPRLIRKFLIDKLATPIERSCPYVPRSDDVIICAYYRSGSSWLQQILHQIRCGGGDESYDDIDRVVWYIPPYMERLDFNLNADQGPAGGGGLISNRLFRCFDCYEDVPMPAEGAIKYIVLVRDPVDVAWSEARSRYRNLGVDKDYDCAAVTELASGGTGDSACQSDKHLPTRPIYYPTYWEHFLSWWANRTKSNVFWLHYEDLLKDLRLCIVELAKYLGARLTDEQLNTIHEHCTYSYMRQNADKFAEEFLIKLRCEMLAVDPWRPLVGRVSTTMTASGAAAAAAAATATSGQGALNLNQRTVAKIRWNWRHSIEQLTGFRSYSQLYIGNSLVRRRAAPRSKVSSAAKIGEDVDQKKNTLSLL